MEALFIDEIRDKIVEARHKVHAIAYQNDQILLEIGNINTVVPMRSTAKPFMICPLIYSCNLHGVHLTDSDISLISSSHNGEIIHRENVISLLELSESDYSDLACGTHLPFFEWLYEDYFAVKNIKKRQLFHNCSAKHAGMLLLAYLNGYKKSDYWEANHPVQKSIIKSVKKVMRVKSKDPFCIVKDGCGVPTYCVSIHQVAKAYQYLYCDDALFSIANAILSNPYQIAGKNRIETKIISHCGFIAKSGSSGLFAISCPKENISIALKVEDGNDDAAESAAVAIIDKLGLINESELSVLEQYRTLPIYTSTDKIAGKLCPSWNNN